MTYVLYLFFLIDQNNTYLAKPQAVFDNLEQCEKARLYTEMRKDVAFGLCKSVHREALERLRKWSEGK